MRPVVVSMVHRSAVAVMDAMVTTVVAAVMVPAVPRIATVGRIRATCHHDTGENEDASK